MRTAARIHRGLGAALAALALLVTGCASVPGDPGPAATTTTTGTPRSTPAGQPVVRLAHDGPRDAVFSVSEQAVLAFKVGQEMQAQLGSTGQSLKGRDTQGQCPLIRQSSSLRG